MAIILGNGPSLDDYDLKDPFFKKATTFGSNAIGKKFRPTYYFIGDFIAWKENQKHVWPTVNKGSTLIVSYDVRRKFPHHAKRAIVLTYSPRDTYGTPTKGGPIYHGRTSGIVMLNIAYQMGFSYIFLLGIDGYSVDGKSHFDGAPHQVPEYRRSSSDGVVAKNLALTYRQMVKEGRWLFDLSMRSVYTEQVPKWWHLPAGK